MSALHPFRILPIHLALLLIVLTALSALSQSKGDSGLSMDGLEGLEDSQKARVLYLLDSARIPITSLNGKKWPRRKNTFLAMGEDTSTSEEGYAFHLFAFDLSGAKIRLMARSDGPIMLGRGETVSDFDFAAYQIKASEYAFGIRYTRVRQYANGSANLEFIRMYRIQESEFIPILTTTTSYEADLAGEWDEDGTRNRVGYGGSAVLIITKRKTEGYFNWIKKADNGKKVDLIWDGNGYLMQGEEPFPTSDLEVFSDE